MKRTRLNSLQTILCAVLLILTLSTAVLAKEVTVIIRVDDLFSINSPVKPREIDGFLKVAEKHGAKTVLAAIPNRLLQEVNQDGVMTRALLDIMERGHQIAQHGFNHTCQFSGVTNREFSTPEALENLTQEERINKILEGRQLLEAVLGRKITMYVGPGADDDVLIEMDGPLLYENGYTWLKDAPTDIPIFRKEDRCSFPVMTDYAWLIDENNYAQRVKDTKENCIRSIKEGNACCLKFHDPFTRENYLNGITLRYLDEMLTWLESNPEWEIRYETLDEYYERNMESVKASNLSN